MIDSPLVMLIVLVTLLAFSAFFSGSETALMAITKMRLEHLAETMPRRVRFVERVLENPERLIGTILLGNNLVNVAMSAIATAFALSLWGESGILYVTVILTLAILIFAEITPKVYAKYFNERVSLLVAPLFHVIMTVFNPVIIAVTYVSTKVLILLGIDVRKIERPLFTEAEVQTCIKMARDDGTISDSERKMLSRVFTLNDKTVGQVMIPREKMVVLYKDTPLDEVVRTIIETGFSRFPVSSGRELDIIGFLHAKDVIELLGRRKESTIEGIIRSPFMVSIDTTIDVQLRSFQVRRMHQAVVVDARGIVAGLITLEDILEELVGTIRDEHDS